MSATFTKVSSAHNRRLRNILNQSDNRICADCGAPDPKWASTNIGVFVCAQCSGVHKTLGPQVSKVISVALDEWTIEQIDAMAEVGGNTAANAIYEAHIPEGYAKPGPNASLEERTKFIKSKYEDQEFMKPSLRISSGKSCSASSFKSVFSSKFMDSFRLGSSDEQDGMVVEFIGLLRVKVVRGANLAIRDMMTSDPYVVLTLGQQTIQTAVVPSNLNPVWDEDLMLSVPNDYGPLKLQVYDHDMFSADDIMGEADIDIQPLISAAMAYGDPEMFGNMQIGKWLKTNDNALIEDSIINIIEGKALVFAFNFLLTAHGILMVGGSSEMEICRDASASAISYCDKSIDVVGIDDPVKDSGELDVDFLHDFDSYVEDIRDRLIISRMVNDSIIRGMVNAVEQEAADRIAQKELELARLKQMFKSYRVGLDENELLRPLLVNDESKIERSSAFSRLSDALLEHNKVLESFGRLKRAAKAQLRNLRKDIDQIRGHGSIRKISSVSELVGLGGILQEDEPKKWIDVEKTLDSLRITLDSVYEQVGNIVYSSKASLSQWQQEREYQEEVEQMVVTTCIRGLKEQLEERLWDQNAQWHGNENVSWIEKINEISGLRQELDAISKSLSSPETGTLNSQSSLGANGDLSNNKKTDNLQQKVPEDHVSSSVSLWEENGKHGELVITVPESLDGTQLMHMSKDELINFFKVEMTKLKRNHDYKLQEVTEKYFSLKREHLKERGSSLLSRKDKEFDVLRKKIPDVIVKLDRILVENEKVPLLSNNNDNPSILKDRCDSLLSENRQLRDSLSDRKTEVNYLSSQLSDAMEKMSQYSYVEEKLLERVENLESAIEGAHIEATISWDVYNCLIRGAISQIKWMSEDSEMEHSIMKDIYNLVLKDASCNMSHASESGFKESDLETLAMDGLCAIIFREAFTEAQEKLNDLGMNAFEKERVLKLEVAEKEKLQQHVLLLTSAISKKEKLLDETATALSREKEKYMAASQELDIARYQTNQHQIIISKCNEESSVLKTNLREASEELEQYKGEICQLNRKLDLAVKDLNECNNEKMKLLLAANEKDDILSLVKANENEHRKQMESIIILVQGLFKEFAAFECRVAEYVKKSNLRLENLSSQSGSLIQMINILKRKGLQYKQGLERRCSDLEKAEIEVDLLGDEVQVLLGLLEKIYIALDHYSPVLKHYPGIMEILKLVRRELSGESNRPL
ncbi:hypothetical protein V6N12_068798 [Hibiscus sabdariffa]|uniref:Uncharacterized protein n=1 Tax=Hibiscus sabdariffa TaxID=183260 RepID=A0ABR2B1B1_9ROSI